MKRLIVILIVASFLIPASGCGRVGARLQEAATARSETASQSPFASFEEASGDDVLFRDDFEDGNLNGWKSTTTWLVQKANGNSVLMATGSGQAAWVPEGLRWTDYYVRAGIRLESGGVGLAFRVSVDGRYWLYYTEQTLALLKEAPKGNFTLLQQTAAPPLRTGQALAIGGYRGHLQVYVGQTLQMDYTDANPLTRGTIGVAVANNATAAVDNVIASRLPRDLPAAPSGAQALPATLPAPAQPAEAEGEWEALGEWVTDEEPAPPIEEVAPPVVEEEPVPLVEPTTPAGGEWTSEEVVEEPAPIEQPIEGVEQPAAGLPVIDYFYAEPVQSEPGCYYLHWDLHDATTAYLNGQGITAPGSGQTCEPGTFTLRAENAVGSVEKSLTITAEGEIQEEQPPVPPDEGQTPEEGAAELPDLVVQESTVRVPDPGQPNVVQGHIVIVNMGNVPSPAYTLRWFPHQNSNVVGYSEDGHSLDSGRAQEFIFTYTYPEWGDMHWRATVDPDSEIVESNEANNAGNGMVQVARPGGEGSGEEGSGSDVEGAAELPDLRINSLTVWVDDPNQPNVVQGRIQILNLGQSPSGAYTVRWFPHQNSDVVGYSEDGESLDHGGSKEFRFTYTYSEWGEMHHVVTVDPDNEIAESDETNNNRTGMVRIERPSGAEPDEEGSGGGEEPVAQPDLVIQNARFEPSPVVKGQPFKAIMTIKNVGGAATSTPFRALWHFHADLGIDDCSWQIGAGIGPGAGTEVSCQRKTNAGPGQAPTTLTADAENVIAEPDEVNNDSSLTMKIGTVSSDQPDVSGPQPDLLVLSPRFEPSPVVKGQPFKAILIASNHGSVPTPVGFTALWHFHADLGIDDCTWQVANGIAPGTGRELTCERTTNAGPGQAPTEVTVDAENVIAEPDETNNDVSLTMQIVAVASDHPDPHAVSMPDLTIKNLRITPAKAIPGQKLTVSFDVINQGTAAPASQAMWYSDANTHQGYLRNIPALGAGATYHVDFANIPAPSTPGSYAHYAMADSASLIDEENENNNKLVGGENLAVMAEDHPDTQGPADLVIRNLKVTPNPVLQAHDLQVEFEVFNQGQGPAKKSVAEWHTPPAGGLSFRCDVPKLEKGASHKCSWLFLSAPARKNYGTTATADVDNVVNESNEDNNALKETLKVQ